nr:dTMP kinase [candidate division Zixibacteria bacterium]
MPPGYFITFEGIDGSGKTTQLQMAEKFLADNGRSTLVLREPGSTPISEKIRDLLLNPGLKINPVSELMLYLAARAELVAQVIAPAIDNGRIVLCDRFHDSTTAYQGYGRGIEVALVSRLNELAIGKYKPHLTFLIDVDYRTSLTRRKTATDRLEAENHEFFDRVRQGFLQIARNEPDRVIVINGNRTPVEIFIEVKDCLSRKMNII